MHRTKKAVARLSCALLLAYPAVLSAQQASSLPGTSVGSQNLRPYWHVFIAYTIVIVLVFGWVISIGRRLKDVEKRLDK
jgi:CcmD family protein